MQQQTQSESNSPRKRMARKIVSETYSQAPTTSDSHNNSQVNYACYPNGNIGYQSSRVLQHHNQPKKDFISRFEGKVSQISKEGHIGVVLTADRPIQKVHEIKVSGSPHQRMLNAAVNDAGKSSKERTPQNNSPADIIGTSRQKMHAKTIEQQPTTQQKIVSLKQKFESQYSKEGGMSINLEEFRMPKRKDNSILPHIELQKGFRSNDNPHSNFSAQVFNTQKIQALKGIHDIHNNNKSNSNLSIQQSSGQQVNQQNMQSINHFQNKSPYQLFQSQRLQNTLEDSSPHHYSIRTEPIIALSQRQVGDFNNQSNKSKPSRAPRSHTQIPPTPNSMNQIDIQSTRSMSTSMNKSYIQNVGNQIIKPTVVSNKKLFSNIGGLGPINVGMDDWIKAKEKQERINQYKHQISASNIQNLSNSVLKPAQTIYLNFQA